MNRHLKFTAIAYRALVYYSFSGGEINGEIFLKRFRNPIHIVICALALLTFSAFPAIAAGQKGDLTLWYDSDAGTTFTNALPIGNGYIGGMVYGGVGKDRILLNESSLWSGNPGNNNKQGASSNLEKARQQIFAGAYKDADGTLGSMLGWGMAHYLPAGNFYLDFNGQTGGNYYRELDLKTGIAKTTYTANGTTYTREYFGSYPDHILVFRLTADKAKALSFSAYMDCPFMNNAGAASDSVLYLNSGPDAVKYQIRVLAKKEGGSIKTQDNKLIISGADAVTFYVTIGTNFINHRDVTGRENVVAETNLGKVLDKRYEDVLKNHLTDYQELFNRVDINLGDETTADQTTDKRVYNFKSTNDPGLVRLHYQFGRYLLITSSRDGGQPANLQGIWNADKDPIWGSKYTTNINFEMNYWMTETGNLTECAKPFVNKVKSLTGPGNETAKEHWGTNQGWVLHHNTDLWNKTAPIDGSWGFWPMGSGWLSNQIYDYYRFNGDDAYLNDIYSTMKGACDFYLATMITENVSGKNYLVTSPSVSPEIQHSGCDASFGCTMDIQIIRELFAATAEAANKLGKDADFVIKLNEASAKLPPHQIGKYGQLQEWFFDWDNPNDHNRHVSHLYGLFPSNQISPRATPELAKAAIETLRERGDDATGWSLAWKINFWARLLDGDHAYKLIQLLLTPDKTYNNLFDAHPPFQIDGNFGAVSGINEMLIQSQNGYLDLFPALPSNWSNGYAKGIKARGGFVIVGMTWEKGKMKRVEIKSIHGNKLTVRSGDLIKSYETVKDGIYSLDANLELLSKEETVVNIPAKIEAEAYSLMKGIQTEDLEDGSQDIGFINDGDWTQYKINVPENGKYIFKARLGSEATGKNVMTLKDESGNALAAFTINTEKTTSWTEFYTDSTEVSLNKGEQTITLEFTGEDNFLFNVDWFEILDKSTTGCNAIKASSTLSANVIKDFIQIRIHAEAASASLYDSKGALTLSENLNGVGEHNVNISNLANGVYLLKVTCNDGSKLSMPVVITK